MVNYLSLQLGFHFGVYGTHGVSNRSEDKSFVHTLKFECIVGTEKEHLKLGTAVRNLENDENHKMVMVKKIVGTRRLWKLVRADHLEGYEDCQLYKGNWLSQIRQ